MRCLRVLSMLMVLSAAVMLLAPAPVRAQDPVFPLPAPLYILTPQQTVAELDAVTGARCVVSPGGQTVTDFAISPDGGWLAYRQAGEGTIIINALDGGGGFVLEFDVPIPPLNVAGGTIAWNYDASRLAYIVADGVRVTLLGAGMYGESEFATIQGGPWVGVYWVGVDTLIARAPGGGLTQISGQPGQWNIAAAADVAPPAPPVSASLTLQGVTLDDGRVIPGTAGAVAFDWGAVPPPVVDGLPMPADLYYLAPDGAGFDQVWRLPASGEAASLVTVEGGAVTQYAVAPGGERIAYVTDSTLVMADLGGGNRVELAALEIGQVPPTIGWSTHGTRIAFNDQRGLWIVPTDSDQPPLIVLQNSLHEAGGAEATRSYFNPRWHVGGQHILLTIGLWEGRILGVLDIANGTVTTLGTAMASDGMWTVDDHVVTWAASFSYQVPGLFVLDPAAPQDEPLTVLGEGSPVLDVTQAPAGGWYVLTGSTAGIGPRFLRVLYSEVVTGPFDLAFDALAGGFAEQAVLAAPDAARGLGPFGAGLRGLLHDERGVDAASTLVVIDMSDGQTVQVRTSGPVHTVKWGG